MARRPSFRRRAVFAHARVSHQCDFTQLLASAQSLINGLALAGLERGGLAQSVKASGIIDHRSWVGLFATHPPIDKHIVAL